jgi:hypothetical protein
MYLWAEGTNFSRRKMEMLGAKCILKRGPNYCGAKGVCDFDLGAEKDCKIKSRVLGLMDSKVPAEKKKILENLTKKLDYEIKRRS